MPPSCRDRTALAAINMKDERDFGMLWSVAFIMMAITLGFGTVLYIDQQAIVDYKIECALQEFEHKIWGEQKNVRQRPVATVEETIPTSMIHSMVLQ